jgi:hypothetical protein
VSVWQLSTRAAPANTEPSSSLRSGPESARGVGDLCVCSLKNRIPLRVFFEKHVNAGGEADTTRQ